MKKAFLLCVTAILLCHLCSCSHKGGGMPIFVYGFGCDIDSDDRIVLTVVAQKQDAESKEISEESNQGNADENTAVIFYEYKGDTIKDAFDAFFSAHKDAYTGTVEKYAVGEKMGEKGLLDFKVHLANSPGLPVKAETVVVDNVKVYFFKNADKLIR